MVGTCLAGFTEDVGSFVGRFQGDVWRKKDIVKELLKDNEHVLSSHFDMDG